MPQSLSAVYIHLVFSTKHRHPFLHDERSAQESTFISWGYNKNSRMPSHSGRRS